MHTMFDMVKYGNRVNHVVELHVAKQNRNVCMTYECNALDDQTKKIAWPFRPTEESFVCKCFCQMESRIVLSLFGEK